MERLQQILDFLKESPQDPFLHYALTMEYVKLEQEEEALHGFEKLISDFPDYIGTYYHFGKFLEKKAKLIVQQKSTNEGSTSLVLNGKCTP